MATTNFLPRLNDYVDQWARMTPDRVVLIQHEDGKTLTYKQFANLVDYCAQSRIIEHFNDTRKPCEEYRDAPLASEYFQE